MSKSRKKHQAKRRKSRKRKPLPRSSKPPPVSWTWKDALLVMGVLAGIIALVALFAVFLTMHRHRRAIESRVDRWKAEHDLSESQVRGLFELEQEFHGTGSPFSGRPKHTAAQHAAHRREINALLSSKAPSQESTSSGER